MKLQLPSALNSQQFLQHYWQKKPLLMRGALPNFVSPIDAETLAGLACEEQIESRLVTGCRELNNWQAKLGPFDEASYADLPDKHWTLLVQDVDKHLPEVHKLLDAFRFIPDWRLDDIMVSYAADQGSVGPHIDDYDVFIIQSEGKRRWQIHTREVSEEDYIDGLDLRILPEFEAEEDWILEPGDVLYLPPKVAHWGVAEGECMSISVGFRAPALQDLASSWCEELIERQVPKQRYRDPELQLQTHFTEITPETTAQISQLMQQFLQQDESSLQNWFGQFVTEQKESLSTEIVGDMLNTEQFYKKFQATKTLTRDNYSRMAYSRGENVDLLFANGESFEIPAESNDFLAIITQQSELQFEELKQWLGNIKYQELLSTLHNRGCFYFENE
jgi:50S ribosomal protein L16 3-hydroxylase